MTRAFLGVPQQWGQHQKGLHNLYLLRGPATMGTKSERATKSLHSWGPAIGRNGYITAAFLGSRNNGNKIGSGYKIFACSGARNWEEWLHNPCLLGVPQ